jgi:hypothetical protein
LSLKSNESERDVINELTRKYGYYTEHVCKVIKENDMLKEYGKTINSIDDKKIKFFLLSPNNI